MNKKIKELAISSGLVSAYKNRLECAYVEGADLSDDIQNFAELIIHECLTAIECGRTEIVSPETRMLVAEDIYSHWKFYESKN